MSSITNPIAEQFTTSSTFASVYKAIEANDSITIGGLSKSGLSFFVVSSFQKLNTHCLLIVEDKENAAYLQNDIERMLGKEFVLLYPSIVSQTLRN